MNSDIYKSLIQTVAGKDCAVLGMGVSNTPLVKLLLSLKVTKSVTVYDKKSQEELGEAASELAALGVRFERGFDRIDGDVIFRSPGIRPDVKGISQALAKGAVLTSEMEMFLALTPAKTFALTGSDGKTTSTTLCGKFLEANGKGKTFVGGNIGTPLLDKCGEMSEEDNAVLELSSFQLMRVSRAPSCSAITNLSPNHMDWHIDEREYAEAKHNIVGGSTHRVVLNADCEHTFSFGKELLEISDREIIFFSSTASGFSSLGLDCGKRLKLIFAHDGIIRISDGEEERELLALDDIKLPGKHNIENYMTAIGLTYGYVDTEVYSRVARSFYGVEHRLQLIRTLDGVDFYNSSIDSSPTRTMAALSALHGRDIVIICGGYDKNLSYEPLAKGLCDSARAVVLTGATAPKIKAALLNSEYYSPEKPIVIDAESFEEAVTVAAKTAKKGGCVLLSPASASFDRFKNFAQRGEYFKELVEKL